MLLDKLTLENFRQFKERQELKFSTDKESNITLILGDNTSGKSTILQSFLWCLYGKSNFKSSENLFNEEVSLEMKNNEEREVFVEIEMTHENYKYFINRKQYCIKRNGKTTLYGRSVLSIDKKSLESGETTDVKEYEIQATIEEILPEDLSTYFFYDTERFGNISDKKDVTNAVKGLLGLTVIENILKRLGRSSQSNSIIGEFYKSFDHQGDEKQKKLFERLQNNEREKDKTKEILITLQENYEQYKVLLEDKEEALRGLKPTMELQGKIDQLSKELRERESYKGNIYKRIKSHINYDYVGYFIKPLIKETQTILEKTDITEEFISGMSSTSIEEIIKRGYCVCGTKIENNDEAINHLTKTAKSLPPKTMAGLVKEYEVQCSQYDNQVYHQTLNDLFLDIQKINMRIYEIDDEIKVYSEQIKNKEDGRSIQQEIDHLKLKISSIEQRKIDHKVEITALKSEINKDKNEFHAIIERNKSNDRTQQLILYAEAIKDYFEEFYNKKSSELRSKLEELVNNYFENIYHGDRKIKIDDKYKVTLISSQNGQDIITDESAGLETVKNFSFIAGLVELAKEKLIDEEVSTDDEVEYPLVLDAPFSNVDEKHVLNISTELPKSSRQLILIVMQKDWNYAAKELESKVGKRYTLDKISETNTIIK